MTMWMILMMLLVGCVLNVENVVHSTENNVDVQAFFEDDRN